MKIIKTIKEMQAYSHELHASGNRIALVPTMGDLHEGHLSLVDAAHRHADAVVVSIFVNPTQFAPGEDLDAYPRNLERDKKLCKLRRVDVIFAPEVNEMYPEQITTWVMEESLTGVLCGKSRPTHFTGVTTVVTKLFNAVLPDSAIFGEKDFQQAAVIKKMTKDLNFHTEIITSPIVREANGLAMSSRNRYLTEKERENATSIYLALQAAKEAIESGRHDSLVIKEAISMKILQNGGKMDYVEIMNPETLQPITEINSDILIAVAAFFGKTRLIDNIVISYASSELS